MTYLELIITIWAILWLLERLVHIHFKLINIDERIEEAMREQIDCQRGYYL